MERAHLAASEVRVAVTVLTRSPTDCRSPRAASTPQWPPLCSAVSPARRAAWRPAPRASPGRRASLQRAREANQSAERPPSGSGWTTGTSGRASPAAAMAPATPKPPSARPDSTSSAAGASRSRAAPSARPTYSGAPGGRSSGTARAPPRGGRRAAMAARTSFLLTSRRGRALRAPAAAQKERAYAGDPRPRRRGATTECAARSGSRR